MILKKLKNRRLGKTGSLKKRLSCFSKRSYLIEKREGDLIIQVAVKKHFTAWFLLTTLLSIIYIYINNLMPMKRQKTTINSPSRWDGRGCGRRKFLCCARLGKNRSDLQKENRNGTAHSYFFLRYLSCQQTISLYNRFYNCMEIF